jgi:hypothetical protein
MILLARMPLKELMLAGTKVKELTPLKGSPMQERRENGLPVWSY